jgi:transposase
VVSKDEFCRRFIGIPGVGSISALAFKTPVADPRRCRRSKTVGAYLALTAKRWQSGTSIDVSGYISKAGGGEVRHPLYEAANLMLTRSKGFSSLKAWDLKIAKKPGHKRVCVAVARKLSVIMHDMWRDGARFQFKAPPAPAKPQAKRAPKLLAATA